MSLLTDQILATAVTKNNLIHIVDTGDTSQNPAGSSFKASLAQVAEAISGLTTPNLETVLNQGNNTGFNDIVFPYDFGIVGDLGYGRINLQNSMDEISMSYVNTATTVGGTVLIGEYYMSISFSNGTTASSIDTDGEKISLGNTAGIIGVTNTGPTSGITITPIDGAFYIQNLNSGNTVAYLGLTSDNLVVTGDTQKLWGSFISTVDQPISVAGTTYKMSAETTTGSYGISVANGSKFQVPKSGVYNIQFSAQLNKSSGTKSQSYIWLSTGGSPIADTNTQLTLDGANNDRVVAAWNWVVECDGSCYYEIEWTATQNNTYLNYIGSPTYGPKIPSLIVTITEI